MPTKRATAAIVARRCLFGAAGLLLAFGAQAQSVSFTPNTAAPVVQTVTTSSAAYQLPGIGTGAADIFWNTGANTLYLAFGLSGSVMATTGGTPVCGGCWIELAPGQNGWVAVVTGSGTTGVTIVGGQGLATGAGGGGSGGSGGATTATATSTPPTTAPGTGAPLVVDLHGALYVQPSFAGTPVDATHGLPVNIVAGGGAGGTSSNFGSAFPSAGTAMGLSDGTNMLAFRGDNTNGLWVNIKTSVLPTGAATAANQATEVASLATIATNTTGAATAANQATANTSLATIASGVTVTPTARTPAVSASNAVTSLVLKASPSTIGVLSFHAETAGAAGFCILYNGTTAPSTGALTAANVLAFQSFPANGWCDWSATGAALTASAGAVVLISSASTPFTYTTGATSAAIFGVAP